MSWCVYILKCSDDTLYTGITNNLERRVEAHEDGSGAKYTKGRGPFDIVYSECMETRSEASKRELEIKSLSRSQKILLVRDFNPL